jgi:hypothetical protein
MWWSDSLTWWAPLESPFPQVSLMGGVTRIITTCAKCMGPSIEFVFFLVIQNAFVLFF